MVGLATKPLDSTMNSFLIYLMRLQDEVGLVDAELTMAQMADLKVSTRETLTRSSASVP